MGKRSISTCRIATNQSQKSLTVTIRNGNEKSSRPFELKVYDLDSKTKEMLPVYFDDKRITTDTLKPLEEKEYKIDVSNVNRKVVFQIIQENGGSGMKMGVSGSSKRPSNVMLQIK